MMNHTMAKQNSKSASIGGSSGKRSITGAFTITLDDRFLPMHLIYGRKTKQSFPRFKFPDRFSNTSVTSRSPSRLPLKLICHMSKTHVKNWEIQPAALVIIGVLRWCNLPFEKMISILLWCLEVGASGLRSIDPFEVISAHASTYDSKSNLFTIDGLKWESLYIASCTYRFCWQHATMLVWKT